MDESIESPVGSIGLMQLTDQKGYDEEELQKFCIPIKFTIDSGGENRRYCAFLYNNEKKSS